MAGRDHSRWCGTSCNVQCHRGEDFQNHSERPSDDNTAYTVNGGALDPNGYDLTMSSLSGSGGIVGLGGANLTVDQATNTAFAGSISGTGGLIKSGNGLLSLNGSNSDTDLTTVNVGTLMIGSGAGDVAAGLQSDVLVANGGALGGFGTIYGAVNIQGGGKLAPGKPEGTLTINGNLTLEQGSQLAFRSVLLTEATAIPDRATTFRSMVTLLSMA